MAGTRAKRYLGKWDTKKMSLFVCVVNFTMHDLSKNFQQLSSGISPEVQAIFEDKPLQTSSVSPDSAFQRSRSHLGRSARAGFDCWLHCRESSMWDHNYIHDWGGEEGKRKEKKLSNFPQLEKRRFKMNVDSDSNLHEMSTELAPREIMNPIKNQAELSDSFIRFSVEMKPHQPLILNVFTRS